MKVIVDTCIWSMALRRGRKAPGKIISELKNLITDHKVQMIGPIRQEILSGVRDTVQFDQLQKHLASFPDLPIETADYVDAAKFFNLCRSKGIQGSNTDFLICAVSSRNKFPIFTTDRDFERFSRLLPICLYKQNK